MDISNFLINWYALAEIGNQPMDQLMIYAFTHGLGFIYVFVIVLMGYDLWLNAKQVKWFSKIKWVFLAIDIPRDSEQTPKAVEQLFSTLSGAHTPISFKEKMQGQFQLSFSFEIISIDGYVQFLVRAPDYWRDLVESAVYSQYPDAEITEVNDYTTDIPSKFPNDSYNMWGTEVVPVAPDILPFKTYTEFEDSVSGEFKDPMASIIETMSKIRNGEQVWLQLLVRPTGAEWTKKSAAAAAKIAGKKGPAPKKSLLNRLLSPIWNLIFLSNGEIMFWWTDAAANSSKKDQKKDDLPSMMLHLTPGERGTLEAIEHKASKIGFQCKLRLIYLSPHNIYNPGRVISQIFGSIKQFSTNDLNAFKPHAKTKTKIEWFMVKKRLAWRRQNLIRAYKFRSNMAGANHYILNTEELASIWHFPSRDIRTPLLQKTESKKSEPPSTLPIFIKSAVVSNDEQEMRKQLRNAKPFNVKLDDKHFESRFAKNTDELSDGGKRGVPPANLPTK